MVNLESGYSKKRVWEIFKRLADERPNPQIELNYTTHFSLLVAVVLSARNTDKSVNKVTQVLGEHIKTPESVLSLGIDKFRYYIKTIGLYNAKAKNILACAYVLVSKHGSQVPNTFEELTQLPGVGRKSANVLLNSLFGHNTIAVDTHVLRVSHRLQLSDKRYPRQVEEDLTRVVPTEFLGKAHHLLVLHGRYICKALKPQCHSCVLYDLCEWPNKI